MTPDDWKPGPPPDEAGDGHYVLRNSREAWNMDSTAIKLDGRWLWPNGFPMEAIDQKRIVGETTMYLLLPPVAPKPEPLPELPRLFRAVDEGEPVVGIKATSPSGASDSFIITSDGNYWARSDNLTAIQYITPDAQLAAENAKLRRAIAAVRKVAAKMRRHEACIDSIDRAIAAELGEVDLTTERT